MNDQNPAAPACADRESQTDGTVQNLISDVRKPDEIQAPTSGCPDLNTPPGCAEEPANPAEKTQSLGLDSIPSSNYDGIEDAQIQWKSARPSSVNPRQRPAPRRLGACNSLTSCTKHKRNLALIAGAGCLGIGAIGLALGGASTDCFGSAKEGAENDEDIVDTLVNAIDTDPKSENTVVNAIDTDPQSSGGTAAIKTKSTGLDRADYDQALNHWAGLLKQNMTDHDLEIGNFEFHDYCPVDGSLEQKEDLITVDDSTGDYAEFFTTDVNEALRKREINVPDSAPILKDVLEELEQKWSAQAEEFYCLFQQASGENHADFEWTPEQEDEMIGWNSNKSLLNWKLINQNARGFGVGPESLVKWEYPNGKPLFTPILWTDLDDYASMPDDLEKSYEEAKLKALELLAMKYTVQYIKNGEQFQYYMDAYNTEWELFFASVNAYSEAATELERENLQATVDNALSRLSLMKTKSGGKIPLDQINFQSTMNNPDFRESLAAMARENDQWAFGIVDDGDYFYHVRIRNDGAPDTFLFQALDCEES